MASMDRHGLDAIRSLHRQLDDDANGAVDLSESDEVTWLYKYKLLKLLFLLTSKEQIWFFSLYFNLFGVI